MIVSGLIFNICREVFIEEFICFPARYDKANLLVFWN